MGHRKLRFEELKQRSQTPESLRELPRMPVYVIVENIRSLHNVGSIFRTCDALRIHQVILTGYTGKPPRAEIDKAALGAVDTVPWTSFNTTAEAVAALREKVSVPVIALEQTDQSTDFQDHEFHFPLAVVLGNEYDGIEQNTLDLCDLSVHIPMFGSKQSLNVSAAFSILGYELFRQMKKDKQQYRFNERI